MFLKGNSAGQKFASLHLRRAMQTGRALTLRALDDVLAAPENIEKLRSAFQQALNDSPLRFWRQYVFPLILARERDYVATNLQLSTTILTPDKLVVEMDKRTAPLCAMSDVESNDGDVSNVSNNLRRERLVK